MVALSLNTAPVVSRDSSQSALVPTQLVDNASNKAALLPSATVSPLTATAEVDSIKNESVRVTSTIGRAASAGRLSRQEAVDIYQQIANLL